MFSPSEAIPRRKGEKDSLRSIYHTSWNAEKARHVDDETPWAGGHASTSAWFLMLDAIIEKKNPRDPADPVGRTFDQAHAEELAQEEELILSVIHEG